MLNSIQVIPETYEFPTFYNLKGDISRKNSERNQKINTKGTPSKPLNNTTEEEYDESNKAANDLVS